MCYFVITGPNPNIVDRHTEDLLGWIRVEVTPRAAERVLSKVCQHCGQVCV